MTDRITVDRETLEALREWAASRYGRYHEVSCSHFRDELDAILRSAPQAPPADPIPMVLYCPRCDTQHIDAPEPEKGWTNPPHKSHLCHGCGLVWRPASVPTTGVESVPRGEHDTWDGHVGPTASTHGLVNQPAEEAVAFLRRTATRYPNSGALTGPYIVSTGWLTEAEIASARADGRMFVDEQTALGFVLMVPPDPFPIAHPPRAAAAGKANK
jgi:hypothetical protein